jgi:hypothetical protein
LRTQWPGQVPSVADGPLHVLCFVLTPRLFALSASSHSCLVSRLTVDGCNKQNKLGLESRSQRETSTYMSMHSTLTAKSDLNKQQQERAQAYATELLGPVPVSCLTSAALHRSKVQLTVRYKTQDPQKQKQYLDVCLNVLCTAV